MDQLGPLIPILLLVGAFYLLILRPARARQSQQQAVVSRLAPGVTVMTTAGLFGVVTGVEADEIELEIAPGVRVRYIAAAIAKVVEDSAASGAPESAEASVPPGDTPEA